MNAFIVALENRPGEMARVTDALAAQEVNILVCGLGTGTSAGLAFVANDEGRARSTLREKEIKFREVPVILVRMKDVPGQAASVTRKLANAGVNIELFLPVDTRPDSFTAAIAVDKVDAAKNALRDQLTTWSYE